MEVTNYEEILIDVCPGCLGVWLDRGELQKIIAIVRAGRNPETSANSSPGRPRPRGRGPIPARNREESPHEESRDRKKKKGWGIRDIFEELVD